MSTTLNLQLRLEAILEIIVRRVVSTLRAQQASVMIYNPESGVLETRASYGLEAEFARNARQRLGEGIAGWVAERQEAVLLGPTPPNEELHRHYKSNRNITSALSLPLKVGDRCVGVLNVNRINSSEPFLEHHRDMLRLFSEHVGTVIDRAEMLERMALRAADLMTSNLRLTELNRMKDVLLATASYERKTPLYRGDRVRGAARRCGELDHERPAEPSSCSRCAAKRTSCSASSTTFSISRGSRPASSRSSA